MTQSEILARTFDRIFGVPMNDRVPERNLTPEAPEETRTDSELRQAVAVYLDETVLCPEEILTLKGLVSDGECENKYRSFRLLTVLALTTDTREAYEQLGRQVAEMAFLAAREDV